ncbi:MAG TPA: HNH endonuclease signature motif containing protein [Actinomycetes bacterium]|nr:HNH endonuclease signature motif containing protein [Actinomycetes bacterium]
MRVETLLGLDEMPGELVGYGPITADTARRIAGEGTWRRLLTDPRTGRFDELSVDTHDPPQDLLDHVLARDRYCRRGLGCRMPANRCDVDHRVNYPRGPTAAGNLDAGCRPDHDIKTFTDTTVRRDRDGEPGDLRITYPSGRSYRLPVEPVLEPIDLDTPPF